MSLRSVSSMPTPVMHMVKVDIEVKGKPPAVFVLKVIVPPNAILFDVQEIALQTVLIKWFSPQARRKFIKEKR